MIIFSPSTPGPQQNIPLQSSVPFPPAPASADKKYAKTLRLTSDQLVRKMRLKPHRGLTPWHYFRKLLVSERARMALHSPCLLLVKSHAPHEFFCGMRQTTSSCPISTVPSRSMTWLICNISFSLASSRSDALGHVFTMIGRDWTHLGVAKLYTDICRNGYKIMYLTSRAIGQADSTRDYLKGINQNNYQLPEGPVIMSPDRLLTSLHRYA